MIPEDQSSLDLGTFLLCIHDRGWRDEPRGQILSTFFAALAAIIAAASSWVSLRATKAHEEEARLARPVTRFQLITGLETEYHSQYPQIWAPLASTGWTAPGPLTPARLRG